MNPIEAIKLFLKLRKATKEIKEASMKDGIRTTEFWMTVLTVLGSVAAAVAGFVPVDLVLKVSGGLIAVYTIARTIIKLTPSTKDDELLEKVAVILRNLGIKIPEESKPQ